MLKGIFRQAIFSLIMATMLLVGCGSPQLAMGATATLKVSGIEAPNIVHKVSTVADLREIIGSPGRQAVQLLGYYESGDGGGGPVRRWDAAGTCVDNGGSCIDPNPVDANPGRWVWDWSGPVQGEWFGALPDDGVDDLARLNAARNAVGVYHLGPGEFEVSDTYFNGPRGKGLIGASPAIRNYSANTTIIKYIGPLDRQKAVVVMGSNDVGAEPSIDSTDNIFKNVLVDANDLAGFGLYGTYLTNETLVDFVAIRGSLEYNAYFARGWYATFQNIVSLACQGKGLAFGMPLEYQDGTNVSGSWVTGAPLELNQVKIDNVRSHNSGQYYSVSNPGTFDPTNPTMRRQGYGIGAGIGNGFRLTNFLSEGSGGTGLYSYTDSQPSKVIQYGYLEGNAKASGLDPATTLPNVILENTNDNGSAIFIRDIFANYQSGGIFHTGNLGRTTWLVNIYQPRFLKSLDAGVSQNTLFKTVLKDRVYYLCGYYNTYERVAFPADAYQEVNTRYSFTVSTNPTDSYKLIYVKGDGTTPWGSYVATSEDGSTTSYNYPAGLGTEWVLDRVLPGDLSTITKGGGTGGTDSNVTFKIVPTPRTE